MLGLLKGLAAWPLLMVGMSLLALAAAIVIAVPIALTAWALDLLPGVSNGYQLLAALVLLLIGWAGLSQVAGALKPPPGQARKPVGAIARDTLKLPGELWRIWRKP